MDNLNLIDLLSKCPYGTKLYSRCYGSVNLVRVDKNEHILMSPTIICVTDSGNEYKFLSDGSISYNGECMLYPSKDRLTWDGFIIPRFRAEKGGNFYYITMNGIGSFSVEEKNETLDEGCDVLWDIGNYFKNRDTAIQYLNHFKGILIRRRF